MLIDTHLHLDDARYDADRPELLARAREAGVGLMLSIGTALDDSRWIVAALPGQPGIYGAVGIHPERVSEWHDADLPEYEALAASPGVLAIGEVGLDYHSPGFDREKQQRVFREMIRLSRRRQLPLVIHQRDAAEDTLRLLGEEGGGAEGGVFHCFAGDWACAQKAMSLGFDIAVGGILTFPSAKELRAVIAQVPLERLVLETDGPWLAPQPKRGQRNEPAFITAVAATLAGLKNVSLAEVERVTTQNAKRIFRIAA
jgi:TatD DNase family protein